MPSPDQNGPKTGPKRDQKPAWEPPPGIRYRFRADRPKPYLLLWSEAGEEKAQSFADEESREDAALRLAEARRDHGREILNFDPREWRLWQLFKERVGGADPLRVADEWVAGQRSRGIAVGSISISDAVERYIKARKTENLAADTYRHITSHLSDRFAAIYGARPLTEVTPELIGEWLAGLKGDRGDGKMGSIARRHHQKNLKTFLDYCVRAAWLGRNPAELVALPKIPEKDPVLLTLAQARQLFEANKTHRAVGRMALEAFGGQRYSTAARIGLEDIKIPQRGIRPPGPKHKSGKTRFRQGYPENLWAWIAAAPKTCWEMNPLEYRNEKREAFVRAGVGYSENRLRKTFCSAHLAVFKRPDTTSYLMQHTNVETTFIYEGMMDEADGRAYFEIVP